jgi:DNA-binding GntR family transcriptional regulator
MPLSTLNPPGALSRVARKSLKQGVVDEVHAAILRGELTAGQQVTELGLARQLGVSQPTIREALIELEHQGFIQRRGARKTFVTALSERDISEMYLVRTTLETLVVDSLACSEDVDLAECEAAHKQMLDAARGDRVQEFYQADLEFHRSLWRAAGNQTLTGMLEQLVPRLFAFVVIQRANPRPDTLRTIAGEHDQLLRLIRTRDREAARRAAEASLRQAQAEDSALGGHE